MDHPDPRGGFGPCNRSVCAGTGCGVPMEGQQRCTDKLAVTCTPASPCVLVALWAMHPVPRGGSDNPLSCTFPRRRARGRSPSHERCHAVASWWDTDCGCPS